MSEPPKARSSAAADQDPRGSFWKSAWVDPFGKKQDDRSDDPRSMEDDLTSVFTEDQLSVATASGCTSTRAGDPRALPERWADFFCIVGLPPLSSTWETQGGKDEAGQELVEPILLDCYPQNREDVDFPQCLPEFCFPSGCRPIRIDPESPTSKIPHPSLCSTVLTSSVGHRLYGTFLTVFEEVLLVSPGQKNRIPTLIPKCLVLLSHYPFFHAQSTILKEIFYTVQSGTSPIPFERYVAHVIDDIPLPRLGRSQVQWESWTRQANLLLERPPLNSLPLFNLSFEPLFRTISLSNLLVIWATLLQEGRVILCCSPNRVALLTPIAEALLSLLFPLEWQGMYVPVLPTSMKDALEAPLPFLIGIPLAPKDIHHPLGTIMCDLDADVLHLGWDDEGHVKKFLPALPDGASMTLKAELEEMADPLFLPHEKGIKGRMTIGDGSYELTNSMRDPYAQMTRLSSRNTPRTHILTQCSKVLASDRPLLKSFEDYRISSAYRPEEMVRDLSRIDPHIADGARDDQSIAILNSIKRQGRIIQAHADRFMACVTGQRFATPSTHASLGNLDDLEQQQDEIASAFFDMNEVLTFRVRNAFLRFLISILENYQHYIDQDIDKTNRRLDTPAFLDSLNLPKRSLEYVATMVQSQMFERFLRSKNAAPRRRFFAESIRKCQASGGTFGLSTNPTSKKRPTPFLDSNRWQVQSVIFTHPPCSIGIRTGEVFCHDRRFPDHLNSAQCVTSTTISPWKAFLFGTMCCNLN